jgi:branched-chain amino acid transport system substrate-binding protein
MLTLESFGLPPTGKLVINDDHAIARPVYLVKVKEAKWGRLRPSAPANEFCGTGQIAA